MTGSAATRDPMGGRARWSAAFLPGTPTLVPQLTGSSNRPDLDALRDACGAAVARMLGERPHVVVCVGAGTATRRHDPSARGTLAGFGVEVRTDAAGGAGDRTRGNAGDMAGDIADDAAVGDAVSLPPALTLARFMLSAAGWAGPVQLQEVSPTATAAECARLAAALPVPGSGWLVVADGSTSRTARAPGGFDPRSGDFDGGVERALRAGDATRLGQVDPGLALELGASGWAPWQVLARAAPSSEIQATVDYADAPLGVGYLVGSWTADLEAGIGR